MFSQACICSQGRGGEYPIRPPPDTWDTVNKRAESILLECFLVVSVCIQVLSGSREMGVPLQDILFVTEMCNENVKLLPSLYFVPISC